MSLQPTTKQLLVLAYIRRHIAEKGYPPTRAEIGKHFGFKSDNSPESHLRALEAKGLISITPGVARGIRVVEAAA